MIFTSYTYALFLLAAFIIHWTLPRNLRKAFLILASYVFYCSWKWQYGFLLLGVSLFNYGYARWVVARLYRRWTLPLGISVNLIPLIYFKYTGFILASANGLADLVRVQFHLAIPAILLPLGISFFTFQGVAYLIDVASGERPFARLLDFLLFKGFWPQLIAGPIIRADEIRGQIQEDRDLVYKDLSEGWRRILAGAFKKVVLADALAPLTDTAFLRGASPNAMDSVFGILAFGMQIYFDFSGYSDIAIGSARLFGFHFPENFDWPYAAFSPQEFWNRWHMTLSRWIKDYVFTPLTFAFRREPKAALVWLVVAMAVCGLWHGAQWTFVFWGVWHGLLLAVNQTKLGKRFFRSGTRGLRKALQVGVTFSLVSLGWLLFRSQDFGQAWRMLVSLVTLHGGFRPALLRENAILFVTAVFLAMSTAYLVRAAAKKWDLLRRVPVPVIAAAKPIIYTFLILAIIVMNKEAQAFVYFQF
jgi:alginate O-acetyltransferase complex protein AlgI